MQDTKYVFRVYFRDGNEKLLGGDNMYSVLSYLLFIQNFDAADIVKIEEVL